jgi:hypothetical protein
MPARLSRHVLATGAATCALVLGAATPVIARPGPHPPPQGGHTARTDPAIQTSSLAGTTEWNVGRATTTSPSPAAEISAPDDGATTLAVVLIAGGALAAGAGAGFAGGRRVALRLR